MMLGVHPSVRGVRLNAGKSRSAEGNRCVSSNGAVSVGVPSLSSLALRRFHFMEEEGRLGRSFVPEGRDGCGLRRLSKSIVKIRAENEYRARSRGRCQQPIRRGCGLQEQ